MSVVFVALAAGVTAGVVTGGRPSNMAGRSISGVPALALAGILQLVAWFLDASPSIGLASVLASYVLLAAFAGKNIRLVGMPVVLVGLALNIAVITVNGGMPVRAEAMWTVERNPGALEHTAKRHIEAAGDHLVVLGDVIPVKPFHEVVSFGDLVLAAGLANLLFRLMHPGPPLPRRRRRRPMPADDRIVDLRPPVIVDLRDQILT